VDLKTFKEMRVNELLLSDSDHTHVLTEILSDIVKKESYSYVDREGNTVYKITRNGLMAQTLINLATEALRSNRIDQEYFTPFHLNETLHLLSNLTCSLVSYDGIT
jgi:hypothetical protein